MRYTLRVFVAVVLLASTVRTADAAITADLFPGQQNWHRFTFVVVPLAGDVSVKQAVTLQWDNPDAGVIVTVVDPSSTTPILGISAGNDRLAILELFLLAGSYQIWVSGVAAPTHYHMNVDYGTPEILGRLPDGVPFDAAREAATLRVEELLVPVVDRLAQAVAGP